MSSRVVKGWKCFDFNLQCRGFQFEVGKTYKVEGDIKLCKNGFHFHENPKDLFNYYSDKVSKTRVCEIEAEDVLTEDDKSACRVIRLVRELTVFETSALRNGYGDGYGDGDGYGYGYGYGNGDGDGYDDGYGNGDGDGYGYGDGDGDGYDGYDDGYGNGDGDGYGYGYGYGSSQRYKLPDYVEFLEEDAA